MVPMYPVTAFGLALLAAGCDQVLGLNVRAANVVTGTYKQKYVSNDELFAPRLGEQIFAPGFVAFTVTLDDDSRPSVEYLPDGTFSFETVMPGQAYRLVVTAETIRSEFQHTAQHLTLASLAAGRPVRRPVVETRLKFPYPSVPTATSAARIVSTGIYTSTETNLYGPLVTFDWRLALPANGAALGLLDAAQNDRVYAIEYVTDSTTLPSAPPYSTIRSVSSASVTLGGPGTAELPMPMPIIRDTCARLIAPNAAEHMRITSALPRPYVQSSGDWSLFMAPAPTVVGIRGAVWVAVSQHSPVESLDVAPTFHDPFVGMTLIAEASAAASFAVSLPSTTPLQLSNITHVYMPAQRGDPAACSPAPTTLSATVGIPGALTLEDVPLDTDGRVFELDLTRDLRVGWSLAAPGPVDHYSLRLHELVVVNGATTNVLRTSAQIAGQSFALLDSSLLIPGHTYVIAIIANLGRPAAATGDFETLAMPFESATTWSHYFEVGAR